MFIIVKSKAFDVKDEDMRTSLRKLYVNLRSTRDRKEARRQLGKMVQFGLYNSEKVVTDLSTPVQAKLAV